MACKNPLNPSPSQRGELGNGAGLKEYTEKKGESLEVGAPNLGRGNRAPTIGSRIHQ